MSLPNSFVVRLNDRAKVIEDSAAIIGGSPTKYIRLSAKAREAIKGREIVCSSAVGAALAEKLLDLAMAEPVLELLPELPAEVTIVIPVMNRTSALERLLSSIRESTSQNPPRIIVVDDASSKPELTRKAALKYAAEFLPLSNNVGPAGARNAGLALVKSEFVVFIDSDVVINSDTIPQLLRHFADPRLALIAPRITGLTPGTTWIGKYENSRSALDMGPVAAAVKPLSPLSWIPSAVLVGRVSAIAEGFDSELRVGEDVDLVWRLNKAGWRVRYEPQATAGHEHRSSFSQWFALKVSYGTGAVPLAARHPREIAPAVMSPWSVAFMAALMAQRKWSLPVALGIAVWRTVLNGKTLASAQHPYSLGASLTVQGIVSATQQTSALMLKHWWPLTAIGCVFSQRIREAALVAAVVDVAVEYEKNPGELDVVRFGVAKRLDDIAYGTGVWLASWRAKTLSALKPDWSGTKR
jgi:mycofactocin glycosyltransferase